MAIAAAQNPSHPERGVSYSILLQDADDVAEVQLAIRPGYPHLDWEQADVSIQKAQGVRVTRTNSSAAAFARNADGHGTRTGWEPWSEPGATILPVRDPITGFRFHASAANQSVTLWTRYPLRSLPVDVTFA